MNAPSTLLVGTATNNEFGDFVPGYVESDRVSRESPRYVFFPGDVLSPRRKREHPELADGGEEHPSRCLVRTKGYIRRCRITPLEKWGEPLPAEMLPEGVEGYGTVVVEGHGGNNHYLSTSRNIVNYPRLPGEEIHALLDRGLDSLPKGIVQLTPCIGLTWEDFEATGWQQHFFPVYPQSGWIPVTLRQISEQIRAAVVPRSELRQLQTEMLGACEEFRLWATQRVQVENEVIGTPAGSGGWIYRYSDLAETLLPQLEMQRKDEYLNLRSRREGDLYKTVEKVLDRLSDKGQDSNMETVLKVMAEMQAQNLQTLTAFMTEQQQAMATHRQELSEALARLAPRQSDEKGKKELFRKE